MATSKIRVVLGDNIKREAVLINPGVSTAEPTFASEAPETQTEAPSNIIAIGETSRQILKKVYGR